MKKILFLSSLFCLATGTYAQNYRGSDADRMMYPDTPRSTMEFTDGQLAKEYKYKVSVSGTTVYFNL